MTKLGLVLATAGVCFPAARRARLAARPAVLLLLRLLPPRGSMAVRALVLRRSVAGRMVLVLAAATRCAVLPSRLTVGGAVSASVPARVGLPMTSALRAAIL